MADRFATVRMGSYGEPATGSETIPSGFNCTLAYDLSNFLRTLALPEPVEHWSLTTLREKLIKVGTKVVRHGRYITFQVAEVAISRPVSAEIPRLIDGLRPAPLPP